MAVVEIPDEKVVLREENEIREYLAGIGITYERWQTGRVSSDAPAEELLAAYAPEINALKAQCGYTTADIVDVTAQTEGLSAMLAKFNREHWHDEDEVRITLRGRGLFHIHPEGKPVVAIEVTEGDLIRVPRGTHHWFNLCGDLNIRAIRLFQDTTGWTPHYTATGVDSRYEPVCFGPAYFGSRQASAIDIQS
jgi:1,2-dihydroxy-3-keto-5-methylthiopentene dioxygenase